MKLDLQEINTGSSGDSGPTTHRRRKGKWKTPERARRPADGYPHDSDPFFSARDGDERESRHRRGMAGGGGGDSPMESEGEDGDPPPPYWSSEPTVCGTEAPRWGDMDKNDDMDFGYTGKPPSSDPTRRPGGAPPGPPGGGLPGPRAEDHQDPLEDIHQVDPEADDLAEEDPLDLAGPAKALREDPLATPTAHREMESRRPPGGGSSTFAGGSRPSSAR